MLIGQYFLTKMISCKLVFLRETETGTELELGLPVRQLSCDRDTDLVIIFLAQNVQYARDN